MSTGDDSHCELVGLVILLRLHGLWDALGLRWYLLPSCLPLLLKPQMRLKFLYLLSN